MPGYVPDGRDELEHLVDNVAGMFRDAEIALSKSLAPKRAEGLLTKDDIVRVSALADQRLEAERLASRIVTLSDKAVDDVIATARARGAAAAVSEINDLTRGTTLLGKGAARFGGAFSEADVYKGAIDYADLALDPKSVRAVMSSSSAAIALAAELKSNIRDAAARVLRWPDDLYREATAKAANLVLMGVKTSQQAQRQAVADLVAKGITGFRDSAGRNWNVASYVETATRTATRRAWDLQHEASYAVADVELVTIVVGSGACKPCADVAGKVWRVDSGPTGRLTLESVTDGSEVTVNVAGSLDDARSHKWRHPNCRCRTVAYLPGLSEIADVTTYDPKAEADRARLRYLEREVRAEKRRLLTLEGAGDRLGVDKSKARIRALQGKIRAHVDETGLMRQRDRERLNLGRGKYDPGAIPSSPVPRAPGPARAAAAELSKTERAREALRSASSADEVQEALQHRLEMPVNVGKMEGASFNQIKVSLEGALDLVDEYDVKNLTDIGVIRNNRMNAIAYVQRHGRHGEASLAINAAKYGDNFDAMIDRAREVSWFHIDEGVDGATHVITHEFAHVLQNAVTANPLIARELEQGVKVAIERSIGRQYKTADTAIKAARRNSLISDYGGTNLWECLAESFATVKRSPGVATELEKTLAKTLEDAYARAQTAAAAATV